MILTIEVNGVRITFLTSPERSTFGILLVLGECVLHLGNHVVEIFLEQFTGLLQAEFEALTLGNLVNQLNLGQFTQKFVRFSLKFFFKIINKPNITFHP
jgi:hypothetical protein